MYEKILQTIIAIIIICSLTACSDSIDNSQAAENDTVFRTYTIDKLQVSYDKTIPLSFDIPDHCTVIENGINDIIIADMTNDNVISSADETHIVQLIYSEKFLIQLTNFSVAMKNHIHHRFRPILINLMQVIIPITIIKSFVHMKNFVSMT